jgi:septum formation protein
MMRLILASTSAVRAALLASAGVAFDAVPAHIDEDAAKESLLAEGVRPRGIADALAELKALRVSSTCPAALVLGADQVLDFGGELLSKAATMDAARAQLARLRGNSHKLMSAAVLVRDGSVVWRHVEESELRMRHFSEEFLDSYLLQEGEAVLGSVGCYRLESYGAQLFERIEGDYFSVLGLPLIPLLAALRNHGVLEK